MPNEVPMFDRIQSMGMLDILTFDGYEVLKVPGGWIFTRSEYNHDALITMSSTYVPDRTLPIVRSGLSDRPPKIEGFPEVKLGCKHEWADVIDDGDKYPHIGNALICLKCKTVRAKPSEKSNKPLDGTVHR